MKIIFFGTSNVALPVLEALHQHHDIPAVVTMLDAPAGRKKELQESPVSVLAGELGIRTLKPNRLTGNDVARLDLESLQPDLFIVVSYGNILPANYLNIPKYKSLNLHFSLLPKYRGPSPVQTTLWNGDEFAGVTLMQLDEKLDHGPVLTAEKYPVDADDNFLTLSTRLAHESARLLVSAIPDYINQRLSPRPQDEAQATTTKIITKQDGKINWNQTAREIYNQFRALYPWPGIWTTWDGKMVKIIDCSPSLLPTNNQPPGTVLNGGSGSMCSKHGPQNKCCATGRKKRNANFGIS